MSEPETIESPPDVVPTIDDKHLTDGKAPPVVGYRDWDPAKTRVVVFTTNPLMYPKDFRAATAEEARTKVTAQYGRILEVRQVPHRYFFRVALQGEER